MNLFHTPQIVTVFVCTDNITLGYCTRWIRPRGPRHVEKRHLGGHVPLLKGHMEGTWRRSRVLKNLRAKVYGVSPPWG